MVKHWVSFLPEWQDCKVVREVLEALRQEQTLLDMLRTCRQQLNDAEGRLLQKVYVDWSAQEVASAKAQWAQAIVADLAKQTEADGKIPF